ncbi:MAG: TIGR04076 family protein [Paramuribaculum sp.]|nr:TIGR04076 family protein [Paramuribaculum sp.]
MATRRQFLKTIAAASAFLAVKPLARAQKLVPGAQWSAKVIRCSCMPDLQGAFLDDPDAGACKLCHVGQQWKFSAGVAPADICPKLWKAISDKIDSLESKEESCARQAESLDGYLVSCADPTRPVIVKIARIERS